MLRWNPDEMMLKEKGAEEIEQLEAEAREMQSIISSLAEALRLEISQKSNLLGCPLLDAMTDQSKVVLQRLVWTACTPPR